MSIATPASAAVAWAYYPGERRLETLSEHLTEHVGRSLMARDVRLAATTGNSARLVCRNHELMVELRRKRGT